MTTRDPREPGGRPPDADGDDAELAEVELASFGAWLRSELTPVETYADRVAATRALAHAELRRAHEERAARTARARRRTVFLLETSTALAAGFGYVLWVAFQLWPR